VNSLLAERDVPSLSSNVSAVFPVSMPLNEIAGPCARASSNNGAFLPPDQGTAYCAGHAADNRPFRLTVVMSVRSFVSQAIRGKGQNDKCQHQQHRDYVLLFCSVYHSNTLLPGKPRPSEYRARSVPDVDSVQKAKVYLQKQVASELNCCKGDFATVA
jgi:hypothetical protein